MDKNSKHSYGKIWVHFLSNTHKNPNEVRIGQKAYPYFVTSEALDAIRKVCCDAGYGERAVLQITNFSGYNYHGNEVMVTRYEKTYDEPLTEENVTLSKVVFTGYIKFIGILTWDEDTADNITLIDNKETTILRREPKVLYDREERLKQLQRLDEEMEAVAKMMDQNKEALYKLEKNCKNYVTIETDIDSDVVPYGTVNLMSVATPGYSLGTSSIYAENGDICNSQSTSETDSYFTMSFPEGAEPILWEKENPWTNCRYITFKNNHSIIINEKEKNSMFENVFKGFDFGKANSVKTSIYGPAFRCGDVYLSYDKGISNYVDVTDLILDIENMNYKMPIAASAVAVGDYILHQHKWVRVLQVLAGGRLEVEDMQEKQVVTILPVKNVFGFDFYTKLYCFADNLLSGAATAENPFGNILPLMLFSKGDSKDNLLPLLLMGGSGKEVNPMLLYALMSEKGSDNSLLMMLALGGGNLNFNFPAFGAINESKDKNLKGEDE